MFSLLYSGFIFLYVFFIRIASLFNQKAEKWIRGRKDLFMLMKAAMKKEGKKKPTAWFHCASLGEFEQGRPVIEAFRKKFPEYRILVTFFSPSGYDVRYKYDQADWVFYLPADTKKNAREFIDLFSPDKVFFIKYEYWFNFLDELFARRIPVYMISSSFRKSHYFFSWYGYWFRKRLKKISWFFLQDEESFRLLKSIGMERCSVSGDTRFDRVTAVAAQKKEFPLVQKFCNQSLVLVAGSTWEEDEQVLLPFMNNDHKVKVIIAPHEVGSARITSLVSKIRRPVVKYSEAQDKDPAGYDVLVIDTIGILATLYKYATVSYVGGAFGRGLHNILEPAAFGIPVFFGSEFSKFREAQELIDLGGAVTVSGSSDFEKKCREVLHDPGSLQLKSKICSDFVARRQGATLRILEKL